MWASCTKLYNAITGHSKFSLCVTFIKQAFLLKVVVTTVFVLVNIWYGGGIINVWSKLHRRYFSIESINTTEIIHTVTPFCDGFPDDVLLFDASENDTSFCCGRCALVSSSGQLTGSKAGAEIDSNECVIRMNNAPTAGYQTDVGSRTTFRIFSHTSVVDVKNFLHLNKLEETSTLFIAWGPERNMKLGGITHTHLKDITKLFPSATIYTFTNERVKRADDIFQEETGKNRLRSGAYLSTGWFSLLFAQEVCREINIFGMVEDDHCDKVLSRVFKDSPYHYYNAGTSQCATYKHHENVARGGHRFITEKKIFKKWAKEWNNTKFYHPMWTL